MRTLYLSVFITGVCGLLVRNHYRSGLNWNSKNLYGFRWGAMVSVKGQFSSNREINIKTASCFREKALTLQSLCARALFCI